MSKNEMIATLKAREQHTYKNYKHAESLLGKHHSVTKLEKARWHELWVLLLEMGITPISKD